MVALDHAQSDDDDDDDDISIWMLQLFFQEINFIQTQL